MNKEILYNNVISILEDDYTSLFYKGFENYKRHLLPKILNFEKFFIHERIILSDAYYLLGFIQDTNHAPLKALELYEESLRYDSENTDSLLAACQNYNLIGDYPKAFEKVNQLIKIEPDDENCQHLKQIVQDNLNYQHKPQLTQNSREWKYCELIANENFNEVINSLSEIAIVLNTDLFLIKNRAYGANQNLDIHINNWKKILNSDQEIYLDYPDWFYLPNEMKNRIDIWENLKLNNDKISEDSVFYLLDSFEMHYSESMSIKDMRIEICNFFIARNNNNQDELNKIKNKYPYWQGYNFID